VENKQRYNGHTVSRLTAHIVWVTKYRYKVLEGDIKVRYRTLIKQICEAEDITVDSTSKCDTFKKHLLRNLKT